MKHQNILNNIIPELRENPSISAVMLMGSVAAGNQNPTSDLNLFVLGKTNRFVTETIDNILVEYLYITYEEALQRLGKNGMEVYHYLGSKVLFDLDGRLLKLLQQAMNRYRDYKAQDKDKREIRHWLSGTRLKLNGCLGKGDILKAQYLTATTSWKAIEAVFAVNDIPMPPSSRVIGELINLKNTPHKDWFIRLFDNDTMLRTCAILDIIDWVLPLL